MKSINELINEQKINEAAGAEDRNSVYDYHAVDFYIRAGLRTLCHV